MSETPTPAPAPAPAPAKKPGFWKQLGNAALELIGSALYQGPK